MHRDLVERAMAGDREAFTELTRRSIGRLYAIARLILRDSERAEDATQEALVAAWRQLSALRDPDRFEAWLRRLLIRACYREAGKEGRQRRMAVRVIPVATATADPGIAVADQDELERGFAHLAPDQRALIVLHYYLGPPDARDVRDPRRSRGNGQVPTPPHHPAAARGP
jgi:RNA polymerase sigma-70 factor (ECF subfamily)